jgi:hypothetical protein
MGLANNGTGSSENRPAAKGFAVSDKVALALTLSVVGLAPPPSRADEPITLSKVPAAARKFAEKTAPGVKFTKAVFDDANKYYKLRGKDAKGREVRVLSDAGAEFVQVTVSAPTTLKEVPKGVIETHNKTNRGTGRFHFKATKVVRAEQSTAGVESKTVLFEFIGKNEQGELMRQVIREDGINIGLGDAND